MKLLKSLLFGLSVLAYCHPGFCNDFPDKEDKATEERMTGDSIRIIISPELNTLTMAWITEYSRLNPSAKFSLRNIQGDLLNRPEGIYFVSGEYAEAPVDDPALKINIGHQAIVPVFNAKNPMLAEISGQGISTHEFARLLSGKGKIGWSDVISGAQNEPVTPYFIDNPEIRTGISDFIKTDPAALNAVPVSKALDLITAIQNDPYAIGFCKLSDIRKENLNELVNGIRLLPIDKNGNGRIDHFEEIYGSPDDLSRGVWIGKYPRALSGNIYALSQTKPVDEKSLAFLTWIMTDGGKYLSSNGYSDLISIEKQANLVALLGIQGNGEAPAQSGGPFVSLSWLIILAIVVALGVIIAVITLILAGRRMATAKEVIPLTAALKENIMRGPMGLYYDRTHTWAFMEPEGMIRVGIDDFFQHVTGSITRVVMKGPGEFIRRGEKMLTIIRYGKQLNLYAPVTGTIRAQNTDLKKNSALINASPYADGWIYQIEPRNWSREVQFMFLGEKYREWLKDEFIRLRNFFETSVKSHSAVYDYAILQDGGELKDNVLADLEPEVWEEFQTKFIDPSR